MSRLPYKQTRERAFQVWNRDLRQFEIENRIDLSDSLFPLPWESLGNDPLTKLQLITYMNGRGVITGAVTYTGTPTTPVTPIIVNIPPLDIFKGFNNRPPMFPVVVQEIPPNSPKIWIQSYTSTFNLTLQVAGAITTLQPNDIVFFHLPIFPKNLVLVNS